MMTETITFGDSQLAVKDLPIEIQQAIAFRDECAFKEADFTRQATVYKLAIQQIDKTLSEALTNHLTPPETTEQSE